jgi:hypothetical protein
MSARRLLLILGGTLVVLLAAFTAWGVVRDDARTSTSEGASGPQAADKYVPKAVVVAQGQEKGQLTVSWSMPIRPDVVATVIYEESGTTKAKAIVNYSNGPIQPQTTVRDLPSGQEVCLSATHVVSLDDTVTNAAARPVCAVPR